MKLFKRVVAGYFLNLILFQFVYSFEAKFEKLQVVSILPFALTFLLSLGSVYLLEKSYTLDRQLNYLLSILILTFSLNSGNVSIACGASLIYLPWWQYYRSYDRGDKSLFYFVSLQIIVLIYLGFNQTGSARFALNDSSWLYIAVVAALLCFLILQEAKTTIWPHVSYSGPRPNARTIHLLLFLFALAICVGQILYMSRLMYVRTQLLNTPTYDMGIFAQMFANMKRGVGPLTTLERDQLLSHFKVHVSPIYYLWLPIYYILPRPEYLQILQVLTVYSAVIPFYLTLRKLPIEKFHRFLLVTVFIFTPAFALNNLYDIHENCFLVPIIAWLIYFIVSRRRFWLVTLVSLLLLLVKEDAGLYLVFIGIFFLVDKRFITNYSKFWFATVTIFLPLAYFVLITSWLNVAGMGAMTDRFSNLMLPGQQGLAAAALNSLLNPFFAFSGLFRPDKLAYLFIVLAALAFLPILTGRLANLILMMPLLIINLLSDYTYQYNLHFQYGYGSTMLLLFMTVLTVLEISPPESRGRFANRQHVLSIALVAAAVFGIFSIWLHTDPYRRDMLNYDRESDTYSQIRTTLNSLADERKILAETFLTTALSQAPNLYDLDYHLDKRFDPEIDLVIYHRYDEQHEVINLYRSHGYREIYGEHNLHILERP